MSFRRLARAAMASGLLLAACTSGDPSSTTTTRPSGAALDGTLTVLGAASLSEALGAIAAAFEAEHDGVTVATSFDGSAKLAAAILEGAPADLFASADQANLDAVAAGGLTTGDTVVFATNVLQIVVPEGNPAGIESLEDLLAPDLKLSLCSVEVPCGRYAERAFERAGLTAPPVGTQDNVKGVLTQVQLGEADAGIVYLTDVLAGEGVEGVDLAAGEQVEASYPASVLADAANPRAAAAFLAFLTGDEAQAILRDLGFGLP